jgi:hypothetical protein
MLRFCYQMRVILAITILLFHLALSKEATSTSTLPAVDTQLDVYSNCYQEHQACYVEAVEYFNCTADKSHRTQSLCKHGVIRLSEMRVSPCAVGYMLERRRLTMYIHSCTECENQYGLLANNSWASSLLSACSSSSFTVGSLPAYATSLTVPGFFPTVSSGGRTILPTISGVLETSNYIIIPSPSSMSTQTSYSPVSRSPTPRVMIPPFPSSASTTSSARKNSSSTSSVGSLTHTHASGASKSWSSPEYGVLAIAVGMSMISVLTGVV